MTNGTNNYPTMCRWTGRILGGLLIFLIVSIAAGQGVPNPYGEPVRVQFGFLALALIFGGIVAGWRWELSAGIVSLLGWGLFVLAVVTSSRGLNRFVIAMALPGGLLRDERAFKTLS